MDNIIAEKLIETLYTQIVDNISDDVCIKCPVVRAVRDLNETIKDANCEKIMMELGMTFPSMKCPCNTRGFNRS